MVGRRIIAVSGRPRMLNLLPVSVYLLRKFAGAVAGDSATTAHMLAQACLHRHACTGTPVQAHPRRHAGTGTFVQACLYRRACARMPATAAAAVATALAPEPAPTATAAAAAKKLS